MLFDVTASLVVIAYLAFWSFVWLAIAALVAVSLCPETKQQKRKRRKADAFFKRWEGDADFDGFTDRWFGWYPLCEEMGWFDA
jgi:hypothetical protein